MKSQRTSASLTVSGKRERRVRKRRGTNSLFPGAGLRLLGASRLTARRHILQDDAHRVVVSGRGKTKERRVACVFSGTWLTRRSPKRY